MPGSYPLYMLLHLLRQDASDSDQCVRACLACSTYRWFRISAKGYKPKCNWAVPDLKGI